MKQNVKEGLKIAGHLTILVRDAKTKKVLQVLRNHNLIVDAGLNLVRDIILGTGVEPTHVAVGTSAAAPAAGDTTLSAEVFRGIITRRTSTAKIATIQFSLTQVMQTVIL